MIDHFTKKNLSDLVVVSPDVGGVKMARAYAKRLSADLVLTDKRRPRPDSVEIMNIIGDVKGKTCVLFDDVVTTARTLCQAAEANPRAGREGYLRRGHAWVSAPGA